MAAPTTRYARAGGAEVAYQVVGDGPIDLVYHHGMCHLDLQWDVEPEAAFNERLASFSRVILFDRRGSGASERRPEGFFPTADEWAADLLAVLDAAGSERAAIFAEAEAGPTAIRFAARHPDRVSALVLGNTLARYHPAPGYDASPSDELLDGFLALLADGWGTPEMFVATFPLLADAPETTAALARLTRAAATPSMAVAMYRHVWQELDVRDDLALVTAPVLVLRNQNAFVAGGAEYLVDHLPDARLVDVADDEGLFFAGEFGPVVDEVATFLTGRPVDMVAQRILTTVVFTDIVDSTRRAVAEGDARWRVLLDEHDRLVRAELARFGGVEVNTTGDGFVARFDRPAQAIRCAQAMAESLDAAGLPIRAGVHTGECELRGTDLAGQAVHVAARVGAAAAPGEVLVSRVVTDLVAGSGLAFDARGEFELKGVPASWPLFAAR